MPVSWVGIRGARPYSVKARGERTLVESPDALSGARGMDADRDAERGKRERLVESYALVEKEDKNAVGALMAVKVMTAPVITVQGNDTVAQAHRLLEEHGVRHLPVLGPDGSLLGMLTDRDVYKASANAEEAARRPVMEIMGDQLLTATIDTPLRTVTKVVVEERLNCIPIINSEQHVVGILTTSDILRCLVERSRVNLWA